jgi:hypothetical protein
MRPKIATTVSVEVQIIGARIVVPSVILRSLLLLKRALSLLLLLKLLTRRHKFATRSKIRNIRKLTKGIVMTIPIIVIFLLLRLMRTLSLLLLKLLIRQTRKATHADIRNIQNSGGQVHARASDKFKVRCSPLLPRTLQKAKIATLMGAYRQRARGGQVLTQSPIKIKHIEAVL